VGPSVAPLGCLAPPHDPQQGSRLSLHVGRPRCARCVPAEKRPAVAFLDDRCWRSISVNHIYIGDIYLIPSVLSNIGYASTSQSDPARTVRRRTFLPVFLLFWAPVRRFSRFQSMLAVARTSQSPPEFRRRRRHLLPPDFPVLSSPLLAPSCYRRRPRCPPRSTVRGRSRSGSRLASPLPATQSVPAQLVRRRLPPAPPDRYRSVKTIQ
jgi:hypothetical protein